MQDFIQAAVEICAYGAPVVAALIIAPSLLFKVEQKTAAILETFGRFNRIAEPGLHFKLPFVTQVAARLNLRLIQSDFHVQVRTHDNAFVVVPISLHHKITDAARAYYELDMPVKQMESFASNVVRAKGAQMTLAQLYEAQNDIKHAIKETLDEKIGKFGFEIEDVVVSQPEPSNEVKASFDRVISSQRALEAAKNEAEASKIKTVKAAEAEAEAMAAYGRGFAQQRIEMAKGSKEATDLLVDSGYSIAQGAAMMVMTNGQEAIVKSSNNKGTVILGSVSGDKSLDDFQALSARLSALGAAKPKVATPKVA